MGEHRIETNVEIGENMPRDTMLKEFLKKFKEKFKLNKETGIIFTDGPRQIGNISTGLDFVIVGKEIAYSLSIDSRCSIFTAELMAVEKACGFIIENDWRKDVLILTDNQKVKDVENNKLI